MRLIKFFYNETGAKHKVSRLFFNSEKIGLEDNSAVYFNEDF